MRQQSAVASTQQRLQQELGPGEGATVHRHVGCHSQMRQMLAEGTEGSPPTAPESQGAAPPTQPRLICFNLGASIAMCNGV